MGDQNKKIKELDENLSNQKLELEKLKESIGDNSMEFEKLKLLFDYTKFHIGLYTGVVTALIALGKWVGPDFNGSYVVVLVISIFLICIAGLCGGTILSNIAKPGNYGLSAFWKADLEVKEIFTKMTTERWARYEHLSFWIGVFFALGDFCAFLL